MKFIKSLGSGTFGQVEQWFIGNEDVALKKFEMRDIGLNYDCVREICILKALSGCKNIVQCKQIYTSDVLFPNMDINIIDEETDCIYMELELFDCDLSQFCRKLSLTQRMKLFDKFFEHIVNALYVIHYYGLIHRDIKPENILVKNIDDWNEIEFCLSDFGGSRPFPTNDRERENLGISKEVYTNGFRSPEVVNGLKYSQSADIYALGMTLLYFCIQKTPESPPVNDEILSNYLKNHKIELSLSQKILSLCRYDAFMRPTSAHLIQIRIPHKLFRNSSYRKDWTMGNNFLTLKHYFELIRWAKDHCVSGSLLLLTIDTFDRLLCTFTPDINVENIKLYMASCLLIVSKINMYLPFKCKKLISGMNFSIFDLAEKEFEVLSLLDWRISLPIEIGALQNVEMKKVCILLDHLERTKNLFCNFSYKQMHQLIEKLSHSNE